MVELQNYMLDASKSIDYFYDNLEGTNALSSAILKNINFEDGEFYTVLRKNITEDQLYGFRWGGVGGGVQEQVIDLLFSRLHETSEFRCIFDDVDAKYEPVYDDPTYLKAGVHYQDQVYYVLDKEKATKEFIEKCLDISDAFWHSLCVLSRTTYERTKDFSLSEADIIEFAKNAELILVGGYDGEGYVFWEKKLMLEPS